MTIEEAIEITGGLSAPSKMPCHSYNLPAQNCNIGSKLRNVPNSVCNKCYALKGFYVFPNPKNAMQRRLQSLTHPKWVEAMTFLINKVEKSGYMRLHDSGDIQNLAHFENICQIARNLSNIKFWLPTKEIKIVSTFLEKNKIPDNLTVRISGYMIEQVAPQIILKKLNLVASAVSKDENKINCPASKQNNQCLNCRACWDKNVEIIWYKKH
jgi:hypothetical protein